MNRLLDRVPAWAITAVLAVVYLILAPPSPDLAAADYRSHLFSQVGFSLWDNSWYGGHHLPAYSLIAPALGSLIGTQTVAAIAMVASTWLFALAMAGHFPARVTRIAAVWFAVGASIGLLSSRVPFDLGLAIGLGAIVLAQRGRFAVALGLTVLSTLASPVAGAFLALAMLAWAVSLRRLGWPHCALRPRACSCRPAEHRLPRRGQPALCRLGLLPRGGGGYRDRRLPPRSSSARSASGRSSTRWR